MTRSVSALAVVSLSTLLACKSDVTVPAAPLDRTLSASSVDGQSLPVLLRESPGEFNHLTQFKITFAPDGLWTAVAFFYPDGSTATVNVNDNGWYRFDGTTLLMHSNFSRTDWPGSVRWDTIFLSAKLANADAYHSFVLP